MGGLRNLARAQVPQRLEAAVRGREPGGPRGA